MADQPVVAPAVLDDAQLLAAARERAVFLAHASKQVSGSLNLDRTVLRALHVVVPALADWAQLMVPSGFGVRYAGVRGDRPADVVDARLVEPDRSDPVGQGRILAAGRPELLHVWEGADGHPDGLDALVPTPALRAHVAALQPADLLGLPLTAHGTTFGTLTLARRAGRGFDEDDVALAGEVADRIALAVDAARVYGEQARITEVLAAGLRAPQLAAMPGLTVSTVNRAGLEQARIGGDFFDVYGADGDWTLLLGDVTGRGAEAAILTGQARHVTRGAAYFDRSPGSLLRVLNDVMTVEHSGTSFLTAVCVRAVPLPGGRVDVRVASAGHPPPLVVRASGALEEPELSGLLVGVRTGEDYPETRLLLERGDQLLLFTDGVFEAEGADGQFGTERLEQLCRAYAGFPPWALVGAVDMAVAEHSAGHHRDDVALLAFAGDPDADLLGEDV